MEITLIASALVVAGFSAFAFIRAGIHKINTSDQKLIEAGWGWVKDFPKGTTTFIGISEILGGFGVVLAPLAVTVFNFDWALPIGILAAIGLVIVMVLANIVHIRRKEFKYTWKGGVSMLLVTVLVSILLTIYPTS